VAADEHNGDQQPHGHEQGHATPDDAAADRAHARRSRSTDRFPTFARI
jgi:hypothetical protein